MECPVCSTEMSRPSPRFFKCAKCEHTFVNFTGDPIKYHKELYRKNNFGIRGAGELENGLFTKNFHDYRKPICKNRISAIQDFIADSNSLLDIGAGGGTFVNEIGDLVQTKECQEVSQICIDNLKAQGHVVYEGDFSKIVFKNTFDLVTCYHVLEHIKDLKEFVEKAAQVCSKYLVVEVPINRNIPSPSTNWDGHYHYFSKQSLQELFSKYFEDIVISDGVQMPALLVKMKKI